MLARRSGQSFLSACRSRAPLGAGFAMRSRFHTSSPTHNETPSSSTTTTETNEAKQVALKWLENVPGQDKAYNFVVGTSTAAILFGYEFIPYTADLIYALPFSAAVYLGYKHVSPAISGLVTSVVNEEEKIWIDAKVKAESRLEQEIHSITGSGITDLVQVTENLFDYAKELTVLEAEAFEHEQKLIYYTKAKQVLDEWVRHETAIREREQKRIVQEVIAGVMESIKDPRFQDRYLEQCVSDVESALVTAN